MIEKRTGKKMASKMFDLGHAVRDLRKVQSYNYNFEQYYSSVYSQGSAKIPFVFIFLVHDRHLGIYCILVCCSEYEVLFSKKIPTLLPPE